MPKSLRLSKDEQQRLAEKRIELNQRLVRMGKEPITDTDLAHFIIEKAVMYVGTNCKRGLVIKELEMNNNEE
jgi:hypothetical protein